MSDFVPLILLDSSSKNDFGPSWRFDGHIKTLQALYPGEVLPVLAAVEKSAADGFHAVGFIAYEAAAALNADLPSLPRIEGLPLAWFAIFRERRAATAAEENGGEISTTLRLEPDISPQDYRQNVERSRQYIANGDTYQVNYTFSMNGIFSDDPLTIYRRISRGQGATFTAFLDTGRFCLISASPELFFSLKDNVITTRPMKGTARRGRYQEDDELQIAALKASAKERAENLMIVDLLRNDLGKIAETGSVRVDSLFDVETYPTLHQMTSTVTAKVRDGVGVTDILTALFPCGSVTGAPKRRSMAIISELEKAPRGVYCGAVGYIAPGGEALFSVAIRTLLFDKETHKLSLGVGSGITTDSKAEQEYQECLLKSGFVFQTDEAFSLIESMTLENGSYPLLNRHLARLQSSALFFGFTVQLEAVKDALQRYAEEHTGEHKVRLLLSQTGKFTLSSEPLSLSAAPLTVAISRQSVDSADTFRYHKTTRRELLDSARKERADVDEVIFLNERGELTEGSYHNLLLKIGGKMLTPARESGLLAGVMRQELLDCGGAFEAALFPADLLKAEEIWLINSVRGMRRAFLA